MVSEDEILKVLSGVVHPETGKDIVLSGMVDGLVVTDGKIQFALLFVKGRDPWAVSIKRSGERAIREAFPDFGGTISVFIKETPAKKVEQPAANKTFTDGIKKVIAIGSAKGGVGKSTVTANLAVALAKSGYKVGVLDADIYGPSQPMMFGVEGYRPEAERIDGLDRIVPAENYGVKVMSIGFFIDPADALIWRGSMATNALRQIIHQTGWGELDYLLIDLPPGTGDVHLSVISELNISGAVIVSTPQKVALADVVRGIEMFRNENISIPVLGLVENMTWFTPAELPENKYYIFGKGGVRELAKKENLPLLAEIPLVLNVRESADVGSPVVVNDSEMSKMYVELAKNTIAELKKRGN